MSFIIHTYVCLFQDMYILMCVCCEFDVEPLALLGQSGDHQEVQGKDISGRCVWWFCGEEQGRA